SQQRTGVQQGANGPRQRVTVTSSVSQPSRGPAPALPSAAPNPAETRRQLLESPAASSAIMMNLSQEMGTLKTMVRDLVTQTRMSQAPQVPEELFDHYLQMVQSQVAEELAADVLKNLRNQLRPDHLKQPEFVREKLAEQLEKLMPVSGPIVRKKLVGPHIVALIGPTGVGKTTTIAKLAAHLKLRVSHSVG